MILSFKHSEINSSYGIGILDEAILTNPCKGIKKPKNQKKEVEPFSVDEVSLILNLSDSWFKNFLAISFWEVVALKWQNIDLNKKKIYINATKCDYAKESTPKTGNRYVPIFDSLIPFLKEQKKITGLKTYVFYSETGSLLNGSNLKSYYWYPLLKRIGLPKRVLYNTRHTFATNMITTNKFSLNQVAYWLGHTNIKMLIQHYNKYITSDLDKIDNSFDVFSVKNCDNNYVSAWCLHLIIFCYNKI